MIRVDVDRAEPAGVWRAVDLQWQPANVRTFERNGAGTMDRRARQRSQVRATVDNWEQAALRLESPLPQPEIGSEQREVADHPLRDALQAVDGAPDIPTRREALARVYAELAEQAIARGRRPAPKRQG
jgi:hypothetical protein